MALTLDPGPTQDARTTVPAPVARTGFLSELAGQPAFGHVGRLLRRP